MLSEQDFCAAFAGHLTKRAVAMRRMHHHGRPEHGGELPGLGVVEVGADLGEVGSMIRRGVQVDAVVTSTDDLGHQEVSDPAGQRTPGRAGEGSVEVSSVWQVSVAGHEAVHVDNRDGEESAVKVLGSRSRAPVERFQSR